MTATEGDLRLFDTVRFNWGGICNGVQRTTFGTIIKIDYRSRPKQFVVERTGGRRNARGSVDDIVDHYR